ncbi:sterigmatocystin 8-O-Methyltransferase [Colletotrichum higginsianum]|nr:sterigmatocystin 8-O-Methyltransferase [Colletotrichum higginsianum]
MASSSDSRLVTLARSIVEHATAVDAYLQQNGLLSKLTESAAADINSPPWMPMPDAAAEDSRQKTMAACQELRGLLGGPVLPLLVDWTKPVILRVIIQLRLAELVPLQPANGAVGTPFADIAALTRPPLSEGSVRRILRHAATHGIFCEPSEGLVAHTATSALLARQPPLRDLVTYGMLEMLPAGMRLADALQRFPGSQDPNDTGSALANLERELVSLDSHPPANNNNNNNDRDAAVALSDRKSLWQVHSEEPEVARRFHAVMMHEFSDVGALLDEFLGGQIGIEGKKIVDVGGGRGALAVQVASKSPTTRFIVQDSEDNAREGQKSLPAELQGRVQFMAHDFFSLQPVKDADIYFFRWILHDWSDEHAVKIIRSLVPALRPGARVILNELVVPRPGTESPEVIKSAL